MSQPTMVPARDRVSHAQMTVLDVALIIVRHWRMAVLMPFLVTVAVAIVVLVIPVRYTASTSFIPETRAGGGSNLAGLAAQFGLNVAAATGGGASPEFYAALLQSRSIAEQLLDSRFVPRRAATGDSVLLRDILRVKNREEGVRTVRNMMAVDVAARTGVVTLQVTMRDPVVAAAAAARAVALVDAFNSETRRSSAREKRIFTERQLRQAEAERTAAEDDVRIFLERNAQFQGSPKLRFQYERLQRQVSAREEVVGALRRSYDDARISEVNDTPVITVIDSAEAPVKKSFPRRRQNVVLGLCVAAAVGLTLAFLADRRRGLVERQPDAYAELAARLARMEESLRRTWLGRRFLPKRGAAA